MAGDRRAGLPSIHSRHQLEFLLKLGRAQGWFGPMKGVYLGVRGSWTWRHPGSRLSTYIFQEARYRQTGWSSSGLTALPQTSRSGGRRRGGLAVWRSSLISSFREPGRQTSGKYFDQRHQFVTQSMTGLRYVQCPNDTFPSNLLQL